MKDKHGKVIYEPYRIKVLNTINFRKSMHYNPFAYIHSEKDILKLVTTLIANTKGEGKAGDDFWVKAETLLYCALIGYIHYEAPVEEQNFSTLIEFINAMEVREDDEEFKNPVDLMFDALEAEKPNHFAVRQYKKYKLAAGETAAEVIYHRADAEKDFMGLMSFSGEQPTLKEAKIAKNYLDEKELRAMGQLVSGYLDFAERQAEREIPMTMVDWAKHLDGILTSTGENLLIRNGTVSHLQAMEKAQAEYKKYKAKTLSSVEKDYLESIKTLEEKGKQQK